VNYSPQLHRTAQKELDRIPEAEFRALNAALLALQSNPRPYGVQKLKGELHRIRTGRWRILYAIFDKDRALFILRVARRSEKTYRSL
jgi:mRNA-degrading endonuclease RelE of RelBE toxin-antitoxin system